MALGGERDACVVRLALSPGGACWRNRDQHVMCYFHGRLTMTLVELEAEAVWARAVPAIQQFKSCSPSLQPAITILPMPPSNNSRPEVDVSFVEPVLAGWGHLVVESSFSSSSSTSATRTAERSAGCIYLGPQQCAGKVSFGGLSQCRPANMRHCELYKHISPSSRKRWYSAITVGSRWTMIPRPTSCSISTSQHDSSTTTSRRDDRY